MGNMENGKRTGSWKVYKLVGIKDNNPVFAWSEISYKDGKKNGIERTFTAAGHLEFEKEYSEGRLHGTSKTYVTGEGGYLWSVTKFQIGKSIGSSIYNKDGTVRKTIKP